MNWNFKSDKKDRVIFINKPKTIKDYKKLLYYLFFYIRFLVFYCLITYVLINTS